MQHQQEKWPRKLLRPVSRDGPAAQVDAEDALIDARRSEAAGMHTIGIIPGSAVEVARMYVL